MGANKVFKSSDRGQNWTAISPDLTENTDREGLSLMGVAAKEITIAKNDGVQSYGNIVQLSESPRQAGVLYAGADDGQVYMTKDDGKNWTNITAKFPGVPKNSYVSRLHASTHDPTRCMPRSTIIATTTWHLRLCQRRWRQQLPVDRRGHPEGPHHHVVRRGSARTPAWYTPAASSACSSAADRGGQWRASRSGLPTVPIHEIVFHPRDHDMIVATHGRSIWILDDATPVRQLSRGDQVAGVPVRHPPGDAVQPGQQSRLPGGQGLLGKNPPYGAPDQLLPRHAQTGVALRIRDAQGAVVREIAGEATKDAGKAGVNRVYWDLRHEPLPAPRTPQPGGGGGGGFGGGGLNGPNVLPGEYRVTLLVGGTEVATKSMRVSGDTAVPMTDADRKVWHDTSMSLHDMQRVVNDTADAVTTLNTQVQQAEAMLKTAASAPPAAKGAVEDASKRIADLRRRLGIGQTGGGGGGGGGQQNVRQQIAQLKGQVMNSTSLPTAMQIRSAADAREDLMKAVQETNDLIAAVPQLYEKLGASGLKPTAITQIGFK